MFQVILINQKRSISPKSKTQILAAVAAFYRKKKRNFQAQKTQLLKLGEKMRGFRIYLRPPRAITNGSGLLRVIVDELPYNNFTTIPAMDVRLIEQIIGLGKCTGMAASANASPSCVAERLPRMAPVHRERLPISPLCVRHLAAARHKPGIQAICLPR
jgi:hypothetical protein